MQARPAESSLTQTPATTTAAASPPSRLAVVASVTLLLETPAFPPSRSAVPAFAIIRLATDGGTTRAEQGHPEPEPPACVFLNKPEHPVPPGKILISLASECERRAMTLGSTSIPLRCPTGSRWLGWSSGTLVISRHNRLGCCSRSAPARRG